MLHISQSIIFVPYNNGWFRMGVGEAIKVHVQHTADLSQYDTHIKVVASSQLK